MIMTGIAKSKPDEGNIKSREPWPERGIYSARTIEGHKWGYLYMNDEYEFYFDKTASPTVEEIEARWGFLFRKNQVRSE